MNYHVDTAIATPAYLQLYDQLKEAIVRGAFPYGTRLPSKRSMAAESGVSVITVEHAYALLREEGYVQSRERSGFSVTFRVDDGFVMAKNPDAPKPSTSAKPSAPATSGPATSAARDAVGTFAAAAGGPGPAAGAHTLSDAAPAFPYSVIAKTARRVLTDYGEAVLERSPGMGCVRLRQAIQCYLACNQGIFVDIEQIVIGSGAEYLYSLVVDLLGRDRIFALESPSYEKIEQVYTTLGVTCELLPLAPDGIRTDALAATHADVLHITPYRSFPSGITAPLSKRLEYVRWAAERTGHGEDDGDDRHGEQSEHREHGEREEHKERGRFIVEDDFESEFSVTGTPTESVFALSPHGNAIYLNTFSKTISPALRIGYMVLPQQLACAYAERLGFLSCTVPTFDQLVVAELLTNGDFERHINRVRRAKRKELFSRKKG